MHIKGDLNPVNINLLVQQATFKASVPNKMKGNVLHILQLYQPSYYDIFVYMHMT